MRGLKKKRKEGGGGGGGGEGGGRGDLKEAEEATGQRRAGISQNSVPDLSTCLNFVFYRIQLSSHTHTHSLSLSVSPSLSLSLPLSLPPSLSPSLPLSLSLSLSLSPSLSLSLPLSLPPPLSLSLSLSLSPCRSAPPPTLFLDLLTDLELLVFQTAKGCSSFRPVLLSLCFLIFSSAVFYFSKHTHINNRRMERC